MASHSEHIKIITVSKDAELTVRLAGLFPGREISVNQEPTIDRVLERFESETYDILLITDAMFKGGEIDGVELLEVIINQSSLTQVLFLLERSNIRAVRSALTPGTYQHARLPVGDEELRLLLENALAQQPQFGTNRLLKTSTSPVQYAQIVGRSLPMQEVFRQIRQAAATTIPVLILGETGTGKDLVAQAVHQQSERREGPYLPINVGALPTELVGSELFGHEKGTFTGALDRRIGVFEQAHEGVVFLDEIGSIDEKVQVSLLRLIEQKKFHRLGGRRSIASDVRLVAATNADLMGLVRQGTFREDLFYRLDVFRISLPPLRARQGDIPLLIDEFVHRYNQSFQKNIRGIAPECVGLLEGHEWPGNVRELKNAIQRAVLVCEGEVIMSEHLPIRLRTGRPADSVVAFKVGTPLAEVEREMIVRALEATGNNRKRAADLLGISRRALYNRLHKYGIA